MIKFKIPINATNRDFKLTAEDVIVAFESTFPCHEILTADRVLVIALNFYTPLPSSYGYVKRMTIAKRKYLKNTGCGMIQQERLILRALEDVVFESGKSVAGVNVRKYWTKEERRVEVVVVDAEQDGYLRQVKTVENEGVECYTVQELAMACGKSTSAIYQMINRGWLIAVRGERAAAGYKQGGLDVQAGRVLIPKAEAAKLLDYVDVERLAAGRNLSISELHRKLRGGCIKIHHVRNKRVVRVEDLKKLC